MAGNDDDLDTTGLSDEEIAALKDDDLDTDDDADDADGDDDTDDNDSGDDDGEDDADDGADSKEALEKKETADKDETEESDDADESQETVDDGNAKDFTAQLQADQVDDYDGKIKTLNDKRDALLTQLEDGDIDMKAYVAADRLLESESTDLKIAHNAAENAAKQNRNIAIQKWNWEQEQFFADKANKIYEESKALGAAFDSEVKDLAAKPENANKTGTWFLKEADKRVRALFGKPAETKPAARKPNLENIPKTLVNLPAAENTETNHDEFAHFDKLDGLDLERALSKLTPEQTTRYLQS